jgi:hypothetical protein
MITVLPKPELPPSKGQRLGVRATNAHFRDPLAQGFEDYV